MLLLSPRITSDSIALIHAAEAQNQPVMRLPTFRPTDDLHGKRISVYGEPLFAVIIATSLNHVLVEPPYDWLVTLPEHYVKRWIKHTTISAASQYPERVFVKNADGMKSFDARVYESGAELPQFYTEDYPVLIAEPVNWKAEFRCFMLDQTIVAQSLYFIDGKIAKDHQGNWLNEPELFSQARKFCTAFIQDKQIAIPPTCVIDVGVIEGRGWAVIEANPTYASGIYNCDPAGVLQAVNRACVPEDEHNQWTAQYEID